MKHYDLIVVGGGLSGVASAIAAARGGVRVLIAEEGGSLGGAAVNALVNPFMPHKTLRKTESGKEWLILNGGIFASILERLQISEDVDDLTSTFSEEHLKLVLDEMCEEYGVEVLFHAKLFEVKCEGERIKSINLATKAGVLTLEADNFIDATGDGDLAAFAGCRFRLGRDEDCLCQPMTLCFRLANIDVDEFYKNFGKIQRVYSEWQKSGRTENPRENVLVFKTLNKNVIHFNTTRVVRLNPTDPFDLSRAEKIARRQMRDIYDMLRENFDFCRGAELLMSAPKIGVRESRMIECKHTLSGEELIACARFDDAIAAGNYDLDLHNPEGAGTSHYFFKSGEYYTIPYRSLCPKDVMNLLVVGRCISCTHEAQASLRVMPIITSIGEAGGCAVSLAKARGESLHDVNIDELKRELRANGAFIGE